jgi:PadR family transcriptional regulator, regulatory protein PadR
MGLRLRPRGELLQARDIDLRLCGTGTLAGAGILQKDTSHRQECLCHTITLPVVLPHKICYPPVAVTQEGALPESKLDLLQGTLDLMVLQTLAAMGSLHGYGIARRIEQVSGNQVLLNQGTIYASLVRLQQRGWISASWGTSSNNRKAKFYSITKRGRKRLSQDAEYWQRLSGVVGRVLGMHGGGMQGEGGGS